MKAVSWIKLMFSIDVNLICFFGNLGRMCLEKLVKSPDDFISAFGEQIRELIPHDFIAKKQSEYLKMCKEQLQPGEFVVVSDFSENYTFVIQVWIIIVLPLLGTLKFEFLMLFFFLHTERNSIEILGPWSVHNPSICHLLSNWKWRTCGTKPFDHSRKLESQFRSGIPIPSRTFRFHETTIQWYQQNNFLFWWRWITI